ncbi:MAG: hypothetical protein MUO40_07045 [Anaerolineaceae bacterium]|nr:hypothetical protein [Anaerolineaceae bacterium]
MDICPICNKEKDQFAPLHVITTAIQTQARRKTGFKQYTITTHLSDIKKHDFEICTSCENRYNRILPYAVWAVAIVLFILLAVFIKHEEPVLMLFLAAMFLFPVTYSISKIFISLNSKMKTLALKERRQTGGADYLVAYTESEYQKFARQNQQNRF